MMAYRSTKHTVTEYSPHDLLYGEGMNLPFDDDFDITNVSEEHADNVKTLAEKLIEAREVSIQTTKDARLVNKRRYDKKSGEVKFEVGDKVFIFNPAVKRSLNVNSVNHGQDHRSRREINRIKLQNIYG